MRILIVSDTYAPRKDGIAVFTKNLATRLANSGLDVHIWVPGPKKVVSYTETSGNITIHREKSLNFHLIPGSRVSYWPFFAAEKVIERIKPDLVHIQSPFLMGMAAATASKRLHIPTLLTYHIMPENIILNTMPPQLYGYSEDIVWDYLMWCYNKADFLTAPTKSALKLLTDHGYKIPSKAISNGVDTELFSPGEKNEKVLKKYGLSVNKKLVVFVGRIDREKNIHHLVEAFGQLRDKPDYHLVICGKGKYFKQIQKLISDNSLDSKITMTGYVSDQDKIAILRSADLFAIASPAELQSIATLEAMACGLPVVAIDKVALRELCRDDFNGYLFKENDTAALAKSIHKILAGDKLRAKFGTNSRDTIISQHDVRSTVNQYAALYKKIVAKSR